MGNSSPPTSGDVQTRHCTGTCHRELPLAEFFAKRNPTDKAPTLHCYECRLRSATRLSFSAFTIFPSISNRSIAASCLEDCQRFQKHRWGCGACHRFKACRGSKADRRGAESRSHATTQPPPSLWETTMSSCTQASGLQPTGKHLQMIGEMHLPNKPPSQGPMPSATWKQAWKKGPDSRISYTSYATLVGILPGSWGWKGWSTILGP
jgi:hypothetical protein